MNKKLLPVIWLFVYWMIIDNWIGAIVTLLVGAIVLFIPKKRG